MQMDTYSKQVSMWEAVKQSLILVVAIFVSMTFAVAFSKGIQQMTILVSRSISW